MRRMLIAVLGCALPFGLCAQETVESCARCHRDALSLEEWDVDELATHLRDMRDGNATHPVPIPALSDEELRALAQALAGD